MRGGTTRNPRVRRRRKRRTAKTPRRTTTLCSASTPSPGHSEISTPRSFLGFVRPPRLFMHLGWGADELAWAALNREQQSSLLVEPRELPDIENYSIQEFLCRRSAEDPTTTADGHASAIGRNSARFRSGLVRRSVRQRTAANTPGPRKAGFRAVGGWKPRRELRLAASMFDAPPSRADLIERRFRRSEPNFHPAEDAGFEPARACTQPAFQIRKPRSTLVCASPSTPAKRSLKRSRMATNEDN
jgi:hypothetical protein